jgi:hypothetical protein
MWVNLAPKQSPPISAHSTCAVDHNIFVGIFLFLSFSRFFFFLSFFLSFFLAIFSFFSFSLFLFSFFCFLFFFGSKPLRKAFLACGKIQSEKSSGAQRSSAVPDLLRGHHTCQSVSWMRSTRSCSWLAVHPPWCYRAMQKCKRHQRHHSVNVISI